MAKRTYPVSSFDICLSNRCNLMCRYCYFDSINRGAPEFLTFPQIKKAVDRYVALVSVRGIDKVSVAGGEPVRLTVASALQMSVMTYLAMLAGVAVMGGFIHWMARTYDANPSLTQCIVFAAYNATPMFVGGLAALYPNLWLAMVVGTVAVCYTTYLLYVGLPTFMNIPREEGFLFSSSVLAVGLVVLVAMIGISVILWGFGMGPTYTS